MIHGGKPSSKNRLIYYSLGAGGGSTFGLHVRGLAVRMKVLHIGRDADNLRELLDQIVVGRTPVIVLDGVEVRRSTGLPSSRLNRAATSLWVSPAFLRASLSTWPNVFIPIEMWRSLTGTARHRL
jgi:hypothetical protein